MLYAQTAKEFVQDAYQLISANSPTTPLYGNDMSKGIHFLNNLLKFYSSSSLLLTISKKISFDVQIGQQFVTFGDPSYVPTPDVTVGRLSNLENAWLELEGVDYPLIDESRNVFFGSYKYFPQLGLPRFVIIVNETNLTQMQLYPAPSQVYTVYVYGKFQLAYISENDDMSSLPQYYQRFLLFALARDLAFFKGRSAAWDAKLEAMYEEAKDDMESATSANLVIDTGNESYLNGSWRVRAGI
jgi:hypothetical protein